MSCNCTTQEFKAIKSALLREDSFTGIDKLPSQSLKTAGRHGQSLLECTIWSIFCTGNILIYIFIVVMT